MNPTLRPSLSFQPVLYDDQQMWMLQDGWDVLSQQLIFPYPLAKMVSLCDGTRNPEQLLAILRHEAEDDSIQLTAVTDTLFSLQQAGCFVDDHSRDMLQAKMDDYLAQNARPMICADATYPADSAQLDTYLQQFYVGLGDGQDTADTDKLYAGLIAPHIDYQRGGYTYAKGWMPVQSSLQQADVVIIWATDHKSGNNQVTLSRLPYQTPYGILPTDMNIVNRLGYAIGEESCFTCELNHLTEHSVELATVWLHHLCRENPPIVIPILVGSFDGHPDQYEPFQRLIKEVQTLAEEQNIFHVASVDLAHVGPAFYTPIPDPDLLAKHDAQLTASAERGDATEWYNLLARTQNANQVCGFSPTYLMLKGMGSGVRGSCVSYEQCPADEQATSLVSICSVLLNQE